MSDFLPQLLFLAVGGAVAPPLLLLTILFLGSRGPLPNATALALGYFTTCAAIGIAGLTLFDGAAGAGGAASTAGRVISASVGGLLIVLGIRSLLNTPDPQIKNLAIFVACVNLIATARLGLQASIVALVLVLLVFATPVLALIGLYAAVPQRASNVLASLRTWMQKNNRAITVALCFIFGAYFLVRGLSGQQGYG